MHVILQLQLEHWKLLIKLINLVALEHISVQQILMKELDQWLQAAVIVVLIGIHLRVTYGVINKE